jgi:hypothetical protein
MSEQEYALCACGKRSLSEREANQAIADAKARNHFNHMKHIPKRKYYCALCKLWHLTSQPLTDKKHARGEY